MPKKTEWKFSEETRAKMSASALGKKKSQEHKDKIRASVQARLQTDEYRANLQAYLDRRYGRRDDTKDPSKT